MNTSKNSPESIYCQQFKPMYRIKFTSNEDEKLKKIIELFGKNNWKLVSQLMPGRSAKQCRDRYINYLSEPHKIEPWDQKEDEILISLFLTIGPKWAKISKYINGRSGNDVKNRWYKHLCKRYPFLLNNFMNTSQIKANSEFNVSYQINYNNISKNQNQKYDIQSLLI